MSITRSCYNPSWHRNTIKDQLLPAPRKSHSKVWMYGQIDAVLGPAFSEARNFLPFVVHTVWICLCGTGSACIPHSVSCQMGFNKK